ncbi:MAG: leucine-rich repeat domain-containing protein [Candidatus Magasanikbacteria bacterium]|nr:leucine-rich repeat domain-containing protein [Candidatus Magasanikbacteria bacterium]
MKFISLLIIGASVLLISGCTLTDRLNITKSDASVPIIADSNPAEAPQLSNTLDLSKQNLQKIPDNVFGKTNLEVLNVSYNQLTGAVQGEIRKLQNLRVLDLSNNSMTGVPAEIGQLENLEVLDLSNNSLTGLPNELGNLKNLKVLNIMGNNYSEADLNGIIEKLSIDVTIVK